MATPRTKKRVGIVVASFVYMRSLQPRRHPLIFALALFSALGVIELEATAAPFEIIHRGQPSSSVGSIDRERVLITHRGSNVAVARKLERGTLRAHLPTPNNVLTRAIDHPTPALWVSVGQPSAWNRLWSGMIGKRGEASITFEVPRALVQRPRGIGKFMFGNSQRVIEHDVPIPLDAIVRFGPTP